MDTQWRWRSTVASTSPVFVQHILTEWKPMLRSTAELLLAGIGILVAGVL